MKPALKLLLLMLAAGLLWPLPAQAGETPKWSIQISPEMELLAGVLTQTAWIEHHGPQEEGTEYFRALQDFFSPYKSHEAVRVAQELTKQGFTYDAPIAFICHLEPLPELDLAHEYSDYLISRAKGRDQLERFRLALRALAEESHFLEFYASWQPKYQEWIAATNMDGEMVLEWLEQFFGQTASESHLILAPAMFPGGGYGATVTTAAGDQLSYQVVRERGESITEPEFPTGLSLEYLSLHEWGHFFVNPALDAHPNEVAGLTRFFRPVHKEMSRQAYSNVHVFMNEQVLRAVTTLAGEELYGAETYQTFLNKEESASFYLTEDIVDILREYQANRDLYPSFNTFVPVLLERIGELTPDHGGKGAGPWWGSVDPRWIAAVAILLIALTHWIAFKKRRARNERPA